MTSAPQTAFVDKPPIELPHPVRMRILFMVMIGVFLAALDQTVVGTALPRIITDLGGNDLYTWAFTAYLLTSTISGPLYGKLSDLFGRRPIFLFGIGIFMVGSLLAGLSQEMWHLIGARGIQGLGAGALFPIALAVIGDLFSPSERGRYQGLFGAVFGLSVLIGPAIGGLLTDTVGWPFVFFFNLPIGAVVFYVVWRNLPSYHLGGDKPVIDYVGAALFTAALVPILIGLTNKQSADWTDPIVGGLILVGLVIGIVFLVAEARAREPIVPLELFRIRSFSISVAAFFLASFGFLAAVVFLPRWFQVVNGSSATESGYQILPLLGGLIISATAAGQLVARTGRYKALIFAALVTMAAGLWLLTNLRADTPIPLVWLWMFITGIGVGPSFAVFTLIVQNSVPIQRLGTATSNLTFFQSVGGTIGLAITGTIFGTTLAAEAPRQLVAAGVPPELAAAGGGQLDAATGVGDLGAAILAQVPEAFRAQVEPFIPAIVDAIHQAVSIATASTFYVGVAASLLAALLVAGLKEVRMGASEPVADSGHERVGNDHTVAAPGA
ncbi:MAG TPA: MDR family MFS transporter [Patescibacteria group bacterium]|jgi:EmrB/QacA subfamily drug resistance transporter|nr:MDR family MFS transporter [Patescibacteria group bacterium]